VNLTSLYFSPNGRISRKEYWLASLPLCAPAIVIELLIRTKPGLAAAIFTVVVGVALIVPSFMLSIKRFHDRDKPGWLVFVGSIPVLGPLWLLLELGLLRGTEGPNRYGPDPLVAAPRHEAASLATMGLLVIIGAGGAYAIFDRLARQEAPRAPAVVA
jgi:uncharacterized membrane protein YhaH (DUF805 family)